MVKVQKIIFACILAAAALVVGVRPAWSQSTDQAVNNVVGVHSWGHVTDKLYRGGQPTPTGFKALQQMGISIVVDFRDEPWEMIAERKEVEGLGMKYVSIPWSGTDYPSNEQVLQFLDLVRANPQAKIFVHCKRGADRTGVMVAAYRIAVQHETVPVAVTEMHQYHYDHFWLPQLERYVKTLPELLSANPLFSAYASVASIASPVNSSVSSSAAAPAGAARAASPARVQ